MSKILDFINKHSVVICLAMIAAALFFIPDVVFAQTTSVAPTEAQVAATGPFAAFLRRGTELFRYTRNALFICAAFAFIVIAFDAIKDGEIKWKNLFYLIVALVLLGVAGFIVSYLADPGSPTQIQTNFQGLQDTGGWR